MPSVILTGDQKDSSGKKGGSTTPVSTTVSVTTLERYVYATVGGIARTFEWVGVDVNGTRIYRDQKRY